MQTISFPDELCNLMFMTVHQREKESCMTCMHGLHEGAPGRSSSVIIRRSSIFSLEYIHCTETIARVSHKQSFKGNKLITIYMVILLYLRQQTLNLLDALECSRRGWGPSSLPLHMLQLRVRSVMDGISKPGNRTVTRKWTDNQLMTVALRGMFTYKMLKGFCKYVTQAGASLQIPRKTDEEDCELRKLSPVAFQGNRFQVLHEI